MRQKVHQQLPITPAYIDHEHAHELAAISDVLDQLPGKAELLELVTADILRGASPDTGRKGMTAEQVLRAAIVRQMNDFTYEELAFHLADSSTYRSFCRIGLGEKAPKKSALQMNIKRLRPATLEAINRAVRQHAIAEKVETARTVRGDCTAVETNIHPPTDSSLLNDGVRVLTRLMRQAEELVGKLESRWSDHTRRARKRAFGIAHARGKKSREKLYRDLIHVTWKVVRYAEVVAIELKSRSPISGELLDLVRLMDLETQLEHFGGLTRRVIDQAERRILRGEKVPASEKLLSLFETHTDIVVKSRREAEFGHKLFLTSGRSGLILDCIVLEGNPADSTLTDQFLERHVEQYGFPPRQAAFDGGFASKMNLDSLKEGGIEDVAFHKKRGIEVADMVRSSWVYSKLVRFRSGVEGGISLLKRCFGLTRCRWRGLQSFVAYVQNAVLACNLLVFARHRLAPDS